MKIWLRFLVQVLSKHPWFSCEMHLIFFFKTKSDFDVNHDGNAGVALLSRKVKTGHEIVFSRSWDANWNSTEQSKFVTGHVIYNPAYTYKFQLKTTQEVITTFLFERCPPTSCSLQEVNEKLVNIFFSKGSGITVSRILTGRSNEWMGRLKSSFSLTQPLFSSEQHSISHWEFKSLWPV